MPQANPAIKLFLSIGKTHAILANRLDRCLGGIGFSEFLILYYITEANDQKMRRVDLADKIGMTASGVTRLLLPMEKVHLIKSGTIENDARARHVFVTPAGKQKLSEALERLEILAEDIIPDIKAKDLDSLSSLLLEIGGKALMN